jgi:lipid-binding SYLF domain-containing protein
VTARIVACLLVTLGLLAAGCTTTTDRAGDPELRRTTIDAGVDEALDELYRQVEGSRQLVDQAHGVLVFPAIVEAAFVIGGSHGNGALRLNGKTRSYHATTSGTFGFQAGAQSTAVYLLFMTKESLERFQASSGWTVGADATVTLLDRGARAQVTTVTAQQPVIGYVLANRGLMAGVSLDGTRITRLGL